jgi:hypothetical protein
LKASDSSKPPAGDFNWLLSPIDKKTFTVGDTTALSKKILGNLKQRKPGDSVGHHLSRMPVSSLEAIPPRQLILLNQFSDW